MKIFHLLVMIVALDNSSTALATDWKDFHQKARQMRADYAKNETDNIEKIIQSSPLEIRKKLLKHFFDEIIASNKDHLNKKDTNQKITKAFVKLGATFNETQFDEIQLSEHTPVEKVKLMIENGMSPEHVAYLCNYSVLKALNPKFEIPDNADGCDDLPTTPLILMAFRGEYDLVRELLSKGADKRKGLNFNGRVLSASELAKAKGYSNIEKLLQ